MRNNDSRTLQLDALNERRSQVVACLKKGMTQKAAAELCGMSQGTVVEINKLYKTGGLKAVLVVKNGRPKGTGRCKHPLKQVQLKQQTPNLWSDEKEQVFGSADRSDVARA